MVVENTITNGRLDIVVFGNGGYEFLARVTSEPEVAEDIYLPKVKDFVASLRLDAPQKFTGIYHVTEGQFNISWGDWQGEIPNYASPVEPVDISTLMPNEEIV